MKRTGIYINTANGVMEIMLYGIISEWSDVSGVRIANRLANLSTDIKTVRFYMNSDGGSVIEGIVIYNQLRRLVKKVNVELVVDGVAASMAAVLLQLPGAKRKMARYTRLMMHQVSGMAFGTAQELRDTADQVESFENDLIDIVAENTVMSAEDVRLKWFNGKDNWLTAEQALEAKLIDEIVDGKVSSEPTNLTSVKDVINYYEKQILNFNKPNSKMERQKIITQLGLSAVATDEQIIAALSAVKKAAGENADLKAKLKEMQNAKKLKQQEEVKNIIDKAVKAKKITESQRESYEALFSSDFKNAKSVLEAIAPVVDVNDFVDNGGSMPAIPKGREEWTFSDWQRKDGEGLQNLKDNHYDETYKPLYKSQFGKDPK